MINKPVLALALGTLGLGMSEFCMMGILPDIAASMSVTIPQAGFFISAYAFGVVVGALLLVFIARTMPLKRILLWLVAIYTFGNLSFSLLSSYEINLVLRFVSGLPHGAFFGVGAIVARDLAREGQGTAAVAGMVSGMTIANLLGVPLGTFLSHQISWSLTYGLIAMIGVLMFISIQKWIPEMPALPDNGFKGQFVFLKRLDIWLIVAVTILGNGGIFCWLSYINPLMTTVTHIPISAMTGVMMIAGLGMVIGNLVSGKLSDKYSPQKVGTVTQGLAAVTLLAIFLLSGFVLPSLFLVFLCAGCLFAVSSPQQVLFLQNSQGGGQMLGAALCQVAFNLGNALGAYLGAVPIGVGYGYQYSALVGMGLAFIGFLFFMLYSKRNRTTKTSILHNVH